jgi:hypothetical protein
MSDCKRITLGFEAFANDILFVHKFIFMARQHNISKWTASMPRSKNPDYIDWQKSQAKNVIISDLEDGVLSAYETAVSSEQAWDVYKNLPEFKDVCFKQLKEGLKDHHKVHI